VAKKEAAKARPVAAAPPPPPSEPPAPKAEQKADPIAKKLAETPPPAPPPPAPAAAPDEKKKPDAAQAEKLKADEQRAADALRQAEEARKMEEQKRADERKRAEERKKLEERRQAELKRKENEKKRREAAAKRKRDEEKKRLETEAAAKSKFDADRIAALLNKVPDKSAPPPSAPPNEPTKAKGPALGAPDARDKQLSATELAMIAQIIKSCVVRNWTVLSGGASAQETSVKIRLRFKLDGTFSAPPQVTNAQGGPYFQAISESALRAVRQCEPYNLPPDKYEFWKDVVMNFSPKDMF
jgi:colicin import membrane protein